MAGTGVSLCPLYNTEADPASVLRPPHLQQWPAVWVYEPATPAQAMCGWRLMWLKVSLLRGGSDLSSLEGTHSGSRFALSSTHLPVPSFKDLLTGFYAILLSHRALAFWSPNSPCRKGGGLRVGFTGPSVNTPRPAAAGLLGPQLLVGLQQTQSVQYRQGLRDHDLGVSIWERRVRGIALS